MINGEKKQTLRQQLKAFDEQQERSGYSILQHADPSVERLLEGFCYITRQLEELLHASSPDFVLHLLNVLWPTALHDIPAMGVVKFDKTRSPVPLPKETVLTQLSSEHQPIKFSSMIETCILPIEIESVKIEKTFLYINIMFQESCDLTCLDKILLYIDPDTDEAYTFSYALLKRLKSMRLCSHQQETLLPPECFPMSVHQTFDDPFKLINCFFRQPSLFLFFEICFINRYLPKDCRQFSLRFEFDEGLQSVQRKLPVFHLHCVPVVNAFSQACEPLLVSRENDCYMLSCDDRADELKIIEVREVNAKTLTGNVVHLLNAYFYAQQSSGVHYVLHKLKNQFKLMLNVNEIQDDFVVSTQAVVHQPERFKQFYWKNTRLVTAMNHLQAIFLDKPSLPLENTAQKASGLLAVFQKTINLQMKENELQGLLNALLCQASPKQLRMIAGIVGFMGKSVFQLQGGVVKEVLVWEIQLDPANFETLSSAYHFSLVLERLIELYRPANVCYQYRTELSHDTS